MRNQIEIKILIIAALFLLPMFAIAEAPDYEVNMRIVENGVERSTPRMLLKEGSEASISISGENHLALGLVVNGSNENEVHVLAQVETSETQMSPELVMKKGEWASVSVGELELHILVKAHAPNK